MLIVSGVIVLALAGVFIYISSIDWNEHKDKISAQISELTGKKVVFEGPLEMSVFPSPYLTATNVKIFNKSGAYSDTPLAVVKSLIAKLSLSSLVGGNWDVSRMSLVEPEIILDIADTGVVNWQSKFSFEQERKIKEIEISLDSVTLEKAKVRLIDAKNGIDTNLGNLNAEIIAQSVFGPYRIEGSYMRGANPEGFAISLGQFADNFATSVNLVINYPTNESYIRFDGSVFIKEQNVVGNVIFESNKIADFANEMLKRRDISAAYNMPLAVSAALKADKEKIDLSNVVVKYGKTSGAGNILIPLQDKSMEIDEQGAPKKYRPVVEAAFNMTDWDLQPAVNALKQVINAYRSEENYQPDWGFDLIGDVKSLKSYYNNETLRNLVLSFDWRDNKLVLRESKAEMLVDTNISIDGSLLAEEDQPNYEFNLSFKTGEFAKLSTWLGYEIKPVVPATYQKAVGTAKVMGNLRNIQISPYELTIDKTILKGEAGVILGDEVKSLIIVDADTINFDNYIRKLPVNEVSKSFAKRVAYRFRQMSGVNDENIQIILKLNLGIYENLPMENVAWDFSLDKGIMNIEKLQIASVANSNISLSGMVSGFGKEPVFKDLKYSLITTDISSLLNKFEITAPNLNTKILRKFTSRGIFTGNMQKAMVNTISKLENINVNYSGVLDYSGDLMGVKGELEVRSPDFVKMVNDFNYLYTPKAFSLGLFVLKGNVVGNADKWVVSDGDMNIGSNNFKGSALFDKTSGRKQLQFNVQTNKMEIERFLNDDGAANNRGSFKDVNSNNVDFIAKPLWDKTRINYAWYSSFDLKGFFAFDSISYRDIKFGNTNFRLKMQNGVINLTDFKGLYNGGKVSGAADLMAGAEPTVKGQIQLQEQDILDGLWAGKKYGIRYGKLNSMIDFNTSAVSVEEFVNNLNANISFNIYNPIIKGWNFAAIIKDLENREKSAGLANLIQNNLQSGETKFSTFKGGIELNKGQYKFRDAVLSSADVDVNMEDEGSLNNWDMKAMFNVFWLSLKGVPGFSFDLSGNMDAPILSVSVDKITNMYDEKEEKIEADRKAKEQARREKLTLMMQEQQNKAKELKLKIDEKIMPILMVLGSNPIDEETKQKFQSIQERIKNTTSQIEQIFTLGLTPQFDEKLIDDVKQMNGALDNIVNAYGREIENIYKEDVKNRMVIYHTKFQEIYNKANQMNADYVEQYKKFPQRLIAIDSDIFLNRQENIGALKNGIDNNLILINDMRYDVTKSYAVVYSGNDMSRMELYTKELKTKLDDAEKEMLKMQENIDKLFKVSETVVKLEEEKAKKRQMEIEAEKNNTDNSGTVSATGTGKVTRIGENSDKTIKKETGSEKGVVKVLDFSSNKAKSVMVKKDNEIIKKESKNSGGIITKATGEVTSASGKVVKQ